MNEASSTNLDLLEEGEASRFGSLSHLSRHRRLERRGDSNDNENDVEADEPDDTNNNSSSKKYLLSIRVSKVNN